MSEFKVEVVRARIEPHPNADAIEICRIGDYQSIVKKGQVRDGDLVAYIPEQAVLPEWLLKEMGFWNETSAKGMLSGGAGNRVRAIKLRGVVSQGLVLPFAGESAPDQLKDWQIKQLFSGSVCEYVQQTGRYEGADVAEVLGITKYEPALPTHMRGRALGVDTDATHNYDFENLKKYPDMFYDGEEVVITEKIHGTLLQVCVVPTAKTNERYYKGRAVMSSKGLGGRGIILDHTDETNLYAQAVAKWGLFDKVLEHLGTVADETDEPVFLFGEVFGQTMSGAGVQDLTYTGVQLDYRAFDICVGNRGTQRFLPWDEFNVVCAEMGVWQVPLLYAGPYSKQIVLDHTDGKTTLLPPGNKGHIREGVVVKSRYENVNPRFACQRKIAKSVSSDYLLRKGEVSEFN